MNRTYERWGDKVNPDISHENGGMRLSVCCIHYKYDYTIARRAGKGKRVEQQLFGSMYLLHNQTRIIYRRRS